MRRLTILAIALSMLLVALPQAAANHNDVGVRTSVGDPDPLPHNEPNTPDEWRPVYHAGGSNGGLPFLGDAPRLAPPDQSGLSYGPNGWIGYIDGVIEYMPAAGLVECALGTPFCKNADDPLYRANPAPGDETCQEVTNRLDPEQCTGEDHGWTVDVGAPIHVRNAPFQQVHAGDQEGAPPVFPGLYTHFIYLFGAGSGPAAGEAPFDYLDEGICVDASGLEDCRLITPSDLTDHDDRIHPTSGKSQEATVCLFAPQFVTLSGESEVSACQDIAEFNDFAEPCESPFYVNNRPGWYIQSGFIDQPLGVGLGGQFNVEDNIVAKGGNRSDVSRIFHYYVNPVNVENQLFCAAPFAATDAPDQTSTGTTFDEATGTWTENTHNWMMEAHDLDISISPFADTLNQVDQEVDGVTEQVNELLEDIPGIPPEVQALLDEADAVVEDALETTDPVVDESNALVGRLDPTVGNTEEPQFDGDNSFALSADTPAQRCEIGSGLQTEAGEPNTYYNRLQAGISGTAASTAGNPGIGLFGGGALHDYTYTDESGLPAESGDQNFNPWSPDLYSFGGTVMVIEDRNENLAFDGCEGPTEPPTAANPDKCAALLPFDAYNADAIREGEETMGEFANTNKVADPLGMFFVLKITGPMVIAPDAGEVDPTSPDAETTQDRLIVLEGQGQHCIVGTSLGLTEASSDLDSDGKTAGARMLALFDADEDQDVVDDLCGEVSGQVAFLGDAFNDQTTLGNFGAAISWAKLFPSASGLDMTEGDSLEVNALLTVQQGGDTQTDDNLKLGSHTEGDPTVAKVWTDGSVTYQWTDIELFQSQPPE